LDLIHSELIPAFAGLKTFQWFDDLPGERPEVAVLDVGFVVRFKV